MVRDFNQGCDCYHLTESYTLSLTDDLVPMLNAVVQEIWHNKAMPRLNKKLIAFYGNQFVTAIEEGYGKKIGINYDTPDGNMLTHLANNVYQFSAAKTYTQLRQLTQALLDDNGKLRTESQFKRVAFQINDTHVNQWLKVERQFAIAGSQMASKWVDIKENKATRFIEFDVVMDGHTSEICKPLHGIIVSVDDPMLHIYYPPNHFGCRTTIRQHINAQVTSSDKIHYPEIPAMFRINLGENKLIFPPGHAYWRGTPQSILNEAQQMAPHNTD
jgi:SPP1 gp7 family putative phage head morphogenesis protein